jgi:hypothetical protein
MREMPRQQNLPSPASNIGRQPSGKCSFSQRSCGKVQDGLGRVFLAGLEGEAIEFNEQNTDDETGALIAIYEGMIADNTGGIQSCHRNDVGTVGVSLVLARTSKGRLEQSSVAQSRRAAVDGNKAVVDRQGVAFLDPERFLLCHFDKA